MHTFSEAVHSESSDDRKGMIIGAQLLLGYLRSGR